MSHYLTTHSLRVRIIANGIWMFNKRSHYIITAAEQFSSLQRFRLICIRVLMMLRIERGLVITDWVILEKTLTMSEGLQKLTEYLNQTRRQVCELLIAIKISSLR